MNTREYLDLAKKREQLNSDNKLAIRLGWSRTKISNYRNLPQQMDNEACRQMAEFLKIPVWSVIADMEAQRQKDPSKKKAWSKLAKMTKQAGGVSANLLMNIALFSGAAVYCILCKIAPHKTKHICDVSPSYQII